MFLRNLENKVLKVGKNVGANNGTTILSRESHSKIPNYVGLQKNPSVDFVRMALEHVKIEKQDDWEKIKHSILNHELNRRPNLTINQHNIDAMIMGATSKLNRLDLSKSYLNYLKSHNVQPNLATLGKYLRFLYENIKQKDVSKEDEMEICRICENLRQTYPLLDSITLENMAMALSVTSQWKNCIDIMTEIKKTASISTLVYSAVASAAFLNKEDALAWDILNDALSVNKLPQGIAFLSFLKRVKVLRKKENINKQLETMFEFFRDSGISCQEEVVNKVIENFNIGSKTVVSFSGQCTTCKSNLERLELTDEEFTDLKSTFFNNVLIGKDIFVKTNPEEVKKFQEFAARMKKYDVVLDGLNIAYSTGINKGPKVFSNIVCSVISHFANQNKSVLMLGRVHMENWPRNNWNYIKQHADIFLTQNISQDDPYLLYCALNSGKDTIIVTRDLMRGHKFLLKERKYKAMFHKWLVQRQWFLLHCNLQGKPIFRKPPQFTPVAQKNGESWHIPYDPDDESMNENYHRTWFCVNTQNTA